MRDRANKAAQSSEVPDESLSLVAKRRKVRELERDQLDVPGTQGMPNRQDNQEFLTQGLQLSHHSDDENDQNEEDAGVSQTKLIAKRRRVIDSDEDE